MQKLPITLYTASQIRELERLAGEDCALSGFELMSRAGYQLFECIQAQFPHAKTLAVFCGGGNNGGDGYVLASMVLAAGRSVSVYSVCDPNLLGGEAFMAYQGFLEAGGSVSRFQPFLLIKADVFVDALLGTGLNRDVDGHYAAAIEYINHAQVKKIAVDIPSGLNADTGSVMGCAVQADCTLTFVGLKCGLFTGQAAACCGALFYASLAIPEQVFAKVPSQLCRVERESFPKRNRAAHKGCFGHVLVVGGELGFSGAARLAAEAALRVGAGLVSVATRASHAGLLNANQPELMVHGVENALAIEPLLAKATVVVMGPGLGQSVWAEALFKQVLHSAKNVVLDADALNILAKFPQVRPLLHNRQHILTPHVGEAARLLNCSNAVVNGDRFSAASLLQRQYGGICVLKGAGTLVADEQEIAVVNTGNPGMASGGMGDVLAGMMGGLWAQGLPLPWVARQGAYLHGLAADLSAQKQGERGLLASDLLPYVRQLVNS